MSRNKPRRSKGTLISAVLLAAMFVALGAVILLRVSAAKDPQTVPAAAITRDTPAPASTDAPITPDPAAVAAQSTQDPTASPEPTPEPEPEYFTISMVGDCTLAEAKSRRGWGIAYQGVVGKNYAYPFANTRKYFEDDYLTIANLECVLSDNYYDSIEQFIFLAPAAYANILSEGCVDFVTLANNHTMDFGQNAYNDTCLSLDKVGVAYAGEDETCLYQTGDGLKVGIYCLYNRLTGNMLNTMSAETQQQLTAESKQMVAAGLEKLRELGAEYTIACLHMGTEASYETSEIQLDMCRSTIDSGFDLVYCTHAHRLQPAEEYGGGMIFYGLGNWSFGGHTNPGGNEGDVAAYDTGIARVFLCRRGDKVTLESFDFIPCCISSSAGTELDSFVPNPNTLNNYQPTPYLKDGAAWQRTMSILEGAYAGSHYVPQYWDLLSRMNG